MATLFDYKSCKQNFNIAGPSAQELMFSSLNCRRFFKGVMITPATCNCPRWPSDDDPDSVSMLLGLLAGAYS